MRWLDAFKPCFGHRAQQLALRRYVQGLLSDSARKSMEAMLARVTDPGSYQAFQHFITDAPWSADRVWRHLRSVLPEREGLLIIDGTSFPKQGTASVGVARQYCGTLGKVANCQVAVTAALWTGVRAYLLGAALYLPEEWLTAPARARARIPAGVRFQEKWRQALTLLRQVRASGVTVTGVLADAEFGDVGLFRAMLHRLRLPYAVGSRRRRCSWGARGSSIGGAAMGRPRTRPALAAEVQSYAVAAAAAAHPRATDQLAQPPRRPPLDRAVCGAARDPSPRLAPASARPGGVAAGRTRHGRHAADQVLLHQPARDGGAAPARPLGPSAVGHRAAVSRAEDRPRPGSLRAARFPAGTITSCSPPSPTTSCRPSGGAASRG